MNKSRFLVLSISIMVAAALTSCGGGSGTKKGGGTKNFKSLTGWKNNDQRGWFFQKKAKKPKAWESMVYVEGGSFTMGQVKDDVIKDWNNAPKRVAVPSYFIGETEVTNYDYKSYLTWLKVVFPTSEEKFKHIYTGSLPDTLVWSNYLSRNDFYTETYFRSEQYNYYPVVGVNWLQANNYCEWLTNRANEAELIKKGILSKDYYQNEEYNYGEKYFDVETYRYNQSNVKDAIDTTKLAKELQIKNPNKRILAANRSANGQDVTDFRLPTEAEWEFAALGLQARREYNQYMGKPIAHNELRGEKGRNKGQYLANFKRGRGNYSGIAGYGNDGAAITADVKQYPSNDIGIYGMLGNVSEWTADVYRAAIDDERSDINYYRGNVYKSKISNNQGGYNVLGEEDLKLDTLADGRFTYQALPGQYEEEVIFDARNFGNGDFQSSIEVGENDPEDGLDTPVYNSPTRKFIVDEKGRVVLEKDDEQRTSDVSDETRVVKGGSWRDHIYWIDPGQRRYLHQAEARSWIGFRVAQDSNGAGNTSKSAYGVKNKPQ